MDFTKEQLSELICKHTEKENGLQVTKPRRCRRKGACTVTFRTRNRDRADEIGL